MMIHVVAWVYNDVYPKMLPKTLPMPFASNP